MANNKNLLIDLINKYIGDSKKFFIEEPDNNRIRVYFPELKKVISFKKSATWERVKGEIDSIGRLAEKECGICFYEKQDAGCCCKCFQSVCIDCSIEILRRNRGKFVCPYCKFTVGNHFYNKRGIDHLVSKLRLEIKNF